jgi:hypothetical protein
VTEIAISQILETIRATQSSYYKLTILAGASGSGKTRLLHKVSAKLQLPMIKLSLLLSERMLSMTRRQRALNAQNVAIEIIDEHLQSGLCIDNTELLFNTTLRLNPLVFLQDLSRNRLIVACWNGVLAGGHLNFGYPGHPDFFSQAVSGYPVVTVAEHKYQLYLTT